MPSGGRPSGGMPTAAVPAAPSRSDAPKPAGPSRRALWWTLGTVVQLGLLVATALPTFRPTFGVPTWHHHVSLALAAVFSALLWPRMTRDRAFLGLGVLVTTALAVLSAFLLLYLKDDLKAWMLKDWAKWWHVAWSWFALAFFLGHTWVNRLGLLRSLRLLHARLAGRLTYVGGLVAIVAAVPLTWSDWGASAIRDPNYVPLTLYTWLAVAGPAYAVWAWHALQGRRFRKSLQQDAAPLAVNAWGTPGSLAQVVPTHVQPPAWTRRPLLQAFTDSWLLPMTVLANVTGFPILYFGTKDTALKYVAKYWHTWPSIAMAVLVFAHTVQFWPAVQRYADRRRLERATGT